MHLELLPMLLGFFTYKAGVLGRGAFNLLSGSAGSSNSSTPQDAATQATGGHASLSEALACKKKALADSQ